MFNTLLMILCISEVHMFLLHFWLFRFVLFPPMSHLLFFLVLVSHVFLLWSYYFFPFYPRFVLFFSAFSLFLLLIRDIYYKLPSGTGSHPHSLVCFYPFSLFVWRNFLKVLILFHWSFKTMLYTTCFISSLLISVFTVVYLIDYFWLWYRPKMVHLRISMCWWKEYTSASTKIHRRVSHMVNKQNKES